MPAPHRPAQPRRRPIALLAAIIGLGLVTAICAGPAVGAAPPSPAKPKVTFTVGISRDVDSLNPFTGIVASAYEVWQVMYDTLVSYSPRDFSPTPSLASSWKQSADGLTWTYTIRSGVSWSDGVPLTAADVAYTYNRVMRGAYEQTNWGSYVKGLASVTAPNDTTVVMKTKAPSPIMTRLVIPILPAHIWSKIGSGQVKSFRNEVGAVGSGPFILAGRRTGQYVRLTANPHYWGGAPNIDELIYKVYSNPDAMVAALKKGELDFGNDIAANAWEALRNTPGVRTVRGAFYGFDEIGFNTGAALADGTPIGDGNPALKDNRVRQALNYAIDRAAIVKRTLNGNGSVGTTFIPPIYANLHYQPTAPYTFDLTKAGRLLDAAGYTLGPDGVRISPITKKSLRLRLFARQESPSSQAAARLVQGWFTRLGIPVDLKVVSEESLTEQIGQGKYDMFEWGWLPDPNADYQLATFTCAKRSYKDGGQIYANTSDSFYCNPEYDRLYALQARQIDPAQRAVTVRRMQQLVYQDAAYAILYNYDDLQAYSTKFTGFVAQPTAGGVLLFQYGAWSYPRIRLAAQDRTSASASGGGSAAIPLGPASAAVLVIVVLAALFRRRRRSSPMDVE